MDEDHSWTCFAHGLVGQLDPIVGREVLDPVHSFPETKCLPSPSNIRKECSDRPGISRQARLAVHHKLRASTCLEGAIV